MQASHWLVVAAGGATGALLRTLVYEIYSESRNAHFFPLPTLTVNILGSFIIGIGYYLMVEKATLPPVYRIFFMSGFLGALSTFSTFSLDIMRLLQSEQFLEALGYILASVGVCLAATYLGYLCCRWTVG